MASSSSYPSVAPTPRREVPSHGITSDMSIPIYPNTSHPTGRAPLHTERPFPFANCYFWVNNMTYIRVRRVDAKFDDDKAIEVSSWEHASMSVILCKDQHRIAASQATSDDRREHDTFTQLESESQNALISSRGASDPVPTRQSTSSTQDSQTSPPSDASFGGKLHAFIQDNLLQDEPSTSELPPHDSPKHDPNIEAIFRMDVFGLTHDDGAEILPLVDVWYELAEHLTADTIPDTRGFYEERDAIVKIVKDARARSPNVPVPLRNEDGLSMMSEDLSFEDNVERAPLASDIVYGEIASPPGPGSDPEVNEVFSEDVAADVDTPVSLQFARTHSPVEPRGLPSDVRQAEGRVAPVGEVSKVRVVFASFSTIGIDFASRIVQDARARSPHVPVPLRNEDGLSIMSEDFSFEDNAERAPLASDIVYCYGEIASLSPTRSLGSDPVNDGPRRMCRSSMNTGPFDAVPDAIESHTLWLLGEPFYVQLRRKLREI
ncbi:hypothetical protein NUW54_g2908 [Trametes sanguinea]|uniref:Uncharacterized protein n=1 Tax=Trametes sanguinea TaxID=158606 RepID=A0ACC1Q277_9APHY|nr:hypothetical protein NUW54_g2908 [Trametes sanguinea]